MSESLRGLVDNSFEFSENNNCYMIRLCSDGRCPFHNRETDLCDIQKEIGDKYFGMTCKTYPRGLFKNGKTIFRSCNTSCPAVIKLLIDTKNACVLESTVARDLHNIDERSIKIDTAKDEKISPYINYRLELLEFYVNLFNSISNIENAIVIGALAAKNSLKHQKTAMSIEYLI